MADDVMHCQMQGHSLRAQQLPCCLRVRVTFAAHVLYCVPGKNPSQITCRLGRRLSLGVEAETAGHHRDEGLQTQAETDISMAALPGSGADAGSRRCFSSRGTVRDACTAIQHSSTGLRQQAAHERITRDYTQPLTASVQDSGAVRGDTV